MTTLRKGIRQLLPKFVLKPEISPLKSGCCTHSFEKPQYQLTLCIVERELTQICIADNSHGRHVRWFASYSGQEAAEIKSPGEDNVLLARKVAKKRSDGDASGLGDILDTCVVISALCK